jgi:hypothetical protein
MPEMLNLLAPLLPGSINGENLPKRMKKKKGATLLLVKKNCSKRLVQ